MFDQLRKAFSNAARSIVQKELTEKDIDNILSDLEIALLQSDIAQEVIDDLVVKLKENLVGIRVEKGQNVEDIINIKFRNSIVELFSEAGDLDLLKEIEVKKEKKTGPFVIAFLGINGTGKTTTVAKVAHLLRKNNVSVVLASGRYTSCWSYRTTFSTCRKIIAKSDHSEVWGRSFCSWKRCNRLCQKTPYRRGFG